MRSICWLMSVSSRYIVLLQWVWTHQWICLIRLRQTAAANPKALRCDVQVPEHVYGPACDLLVCGAALPPEQSTS